MQVFIWNRIVVGLVTLGLLFLPLQVVNAALPESVTALMSGMDCPENQSCCEKSKPDCAKSQACFAQCGTSPNLSEAGAHQWEGWLKADVFASMPASLIPLSTAPLRRPPRL
jgi:hypothetical protein